MKTSKILITIAVFLFALRLLSLPFMPMTDTTEARYAMIGTTMATTGNWITPMLDGAPFWAKPPLSFWATAASVRVFGINDFAVRLPHFLFLLGAAILLYYFVRRRADKNAAAMTFAVMATMPFFIYLSGGVMTDPALTLCVVLAFVSFFEATNNKHNTNNKTLITKPQTLNLKPQISYQRPPHGAALPKTGGWVAPLATNDITSSRPHAYWGYLFFLALGLGLLAKGPLIFVIVGLPLFFYVLITKRWYDMFRALPWIGGIILMLVVAVPWYWAAERATPGFLNYFIIGEHIMRYITPHWAGDLYGGGRGGFLFKIWVCYIAAIFPWIFYIVRPRVLGHLRFTLPRQASLCTHDIILYSALFAFVPLLFFTFSANTVPAYVLPSLPMTAILIAAMRPNIKWFKWFAGLTAVIIIIAGGAQIVYPKWSADMGVSDRYFFCMAKTPGLTVFRTQNYSAEFYSRACNSPFVFTDDASKLSGNVLLNKRDLPDIKNYSVLINGKKMVLVDVKTL